MCVVSLSLLEAVGVLSWVLRLAPAGSAEPPALCSPTPTWGCRPHVSEEGTARAPWGSTLSAAGAPWTHVNALARLLGGAGRNSRNPCCAHCPLSGPEQELGPRGHPNPVFSASSTAAGYVFCMLHRLPEQHDCTFDHMGRGREEAIMKMVKLDRKVGRSCQRIGEGCS